MAVRTATLVADTFPGGGATTVAATVPDGETWILKQLDLNLTSFATSTVRIFWQRANGAQGVIFSQSIGTPFIAHFTGFTVAEPGDQLLVFSSNADFYLWASGSRLEGVAP
jgi:hypothetical protein